jgi:hypothetical protein
VPVGRGDHRRVAACLGPRRGSRGRKAAGATPKNLESLRIWPLVRERAPVSTAEIVDCAIPVHRAGSVWLSAPDRISSRRTSASETSAIGTCSAFPEVAQLTDQLVRLGLLEESAVTSPVGLQSSYRLPHRTRESDRSPLSSFWRARQTEGASGPESEFWVGPDGPTFQASTATVGGSHSEVYLRNHGVGSTWTMPVSVP